MKEIPELADKIRGAGGVKVCYGSDERVLSPMQQAWIADALVAYERARTARPEALRSTDRMSDGFEAWCMRIFGGAQVNRVGVGKLREAYYEGYGDALKDSIPSPLRQKTCSEEDEKILRDIFKDKMP